MTSKQLADALAIPTERVRNWYYRSTGMTALDLLLLMGSMISSGILLTQQSLLMEYTKK